MVIRRDFLSIAVPIIKNTLGEYGFYLQEKTNVFIRQFDTFEQAFTLYNLNSDGRLTIVLNPEIKIRSGEYQKFWGERLKEGQIRKSEIPIKINCYQLEPKFKLVGPGPQRTSISYAKAIEIFIPTFETLILPYFEYFNSAEKIAKYIEYPVEKAKWLFYHGEEGEAKRILREQYRNLRKNNRMEIAEKVLKIWRACTFEGSIDNGGEFSEINIYSEEFNLPNRVSDIELIEVN